MTLKLCHDEGHTLSHQAGTRGRVAREAVELGQPAPDTSTGALKANRSINYGLLHRDICAGRA